MTRPAATARHTAPARDTHGTRNPADLPHGCHCGARWSGEQTCHCATCHQTFTGVEAFDAHQPGQHKCGGTNGMTLAEGRAYPAWRVDR